MKFWKEHTSLRVTLIALFFFVGPVSYTHLTLPTTTRV